ncbi:MAG TPA: GNAT family N-acetyltransferase [Verrucomicrobiae bacterium]|nr:GNAT family N-acetyltransferase [Verrucomicrobiae bacterium]
MITLETDRLILRMFKKEDMDAYSAICADPEVTRYLGDGKTLSRTDAWRQMAAILGSWQLRGYGTWVVEEKATGQFIGRAGFIHPDGWPEIEIGWVLARSHWGRGLATEAARTCLAHGFSDFGLTHVISLIHPENRRSIAVAERLGEVLEGSTELFGHRPLVYGIRNAV